MLYTPASSSSSMQIVDTEAMKSDKPTAWVNPYPTPPSSLPSSPSLLDTAKFDDFNFSAHLANRLQPQLSFSSFPHIADAILSYAPAESLLALRGTCRTLRDRVDTLLSHHVVWSTTSFSVCTPQGQPIPQGDFHDIHLLDVVDGADRHLHPDTSHIAARAPDMYNLQFLRLRTTSSSLCHVDFHASRALCVPQPVRQERCVKTRYIVLPTSVLNVPTCVVDLRYNSHSPPHIFPSDKAYPNFLRHLIVRFTEETEEPGRKVSEPEEGGDKAAEGHWSHLPEQLGRALAHAVAQGVPVSVVGYGAPTLPVVQCVVDDLGIRFGWCQEKVDELPGWLEFVSLEKYEGMIGPELAEWERW